jgi:hypothetical protein
MWPALEMGGRLVRRVLLAITAAVGFASVAHAGPPVSVTECGTVVPSRQHGVLANDLQCGDTTTWGVVLEKGARLELNGFTIYGAREAGVHCPQRCRVFGPGEIAGSGGVGISALRVKVRDVTVRDTERWGITAYKAARLENVAVINTGKAGIAANRVRGWDVTVVGAGGTLGQVALASDRNAITATRAVRINRTTITGSARAGVHALRCIISEGDVSGNQTGRDLPVANEAAYPGGDLRCHNRVKLTDTVCGQSLDPDTGEAWGVCTND